MTDKVVTSPLVRQLRIGKRDVKVFVRVPAALDNVMKRASEMHGRSHADELRIAMEIHATRSMLAALPDPAIQHQLGGEAAQFKRELQADLRTLEAQAYRRPTPTGILVPYAPDGRTTT
ncbi:MAG: hypothetical protein WKF41_10185 [Gaiellaceae bacterium]